MVMSSKVKKLQEYILATRVAGFLVWLPIAVRLHSITRLVTIITPKHKSRDIRILLEERVSYIVHRILRIFQNRGYDYSCLRRSLVLFHFMRLRGLPVVINFGVRMKEGRLTGHAWLTLNGDLFKEPKDKVGIYTLVFSLPNDKAHEKDMSVKYISFD